MDTIITIIGIATAIAAAITAVTGVEREPAKPFSGPVRFFDAERDERSATMRGSLKFACLAMLVGLGGGLSGCVAYPDGPDTYTYAPAYGYYGYPGPDYYYAPGYVSGAFYYYNAPHRYWRGRPYYRGPWHGGPHDFSGHRGHGGHYRR